jgi:hypothetical protein
MTNAEATTPENAATVAEQGAHVAPERASSKKGASSKKDAPKGQKRAKGTKAKKSGKAGKNTTKPAPKKEAGTPRAESKGAKILELIGRPKGATLAEIVKGHGLAETFDPGFPLDRRQEARTQDRVNEDRGRGSRIPGQKVGFRIEVRLRPPPARVGGFFLRSGESLFWPTGSFTRNGA